MTNNKALFAFLIAGGLTASAYGQAGLLGSAGTYSRDGWKFSASYVVEPPLSPLQHMSVAGQTDVMHTDAKDGKPVVFHRFFTDPASRTYWGYDIEVQPAGGIGAARLRFRPFSLRAEQLPKQYHAAEFRALPPPQFPAGAFHSGQTIAIDVLTNPATGQRVVDYIEVSFEPVDIPSKAEPRDFQVSDVLLRILVPSLRVNGETVPKAIVADQGAVRKLIWLSVPGHGKFLLSLCPDPVYPYQMSGVVSGFELSFSWNGDRYQWRTARPITEASGNWNLYVLAGPKKAGEPAQGFSFGGVNSVGEFLLKANEP